MCQKGGNRIKKNIGSTTIELTLLMPVFLGCVFLYIMVFLFFIEIGSGMYQLSEYMYAKEGEESNIFVNDLMEGVQIHVQGGTKIAEINREDTWFSLHLMLQKDDSNPVENLRRWQMIGNAVQ